MPGDVREHVLERFRKLTVIVVVAFGGADMGGTVGDMDNDITVATCGLSGCTQQNGLLDTVKFQQRAHTVMNQ